MGGPSRLPRLVATAAFAVAGLAGGCATEDLGIDPVLELNQVRAENTINGLLDVLSDEDYEAACDELAPAGLADIVTGGRKHEASNKAFSRCSALLELSVRVSGSDFSGVEGVKVTDTHEENGELVRRQVGPRSG
jgi:hypothetical protein